MHSFVNCTLMSDLSHAAIIQQCPKGLTKFMANCSPKLVRKLHVSPPVNFVFLVSHYICLSDLIIHLVVGVGVGVGAE